MQGKAADDTPKSPAEELVDTGRAIWPERESRQQRRKRRTTRITRRGIGTERPHGGTRSISLAWGGATPPQSKAQISQDSPRNVRTCCCRESMETSCITAMGRIWTGE